MVWNNSRWPQGSILGLLLFNIFLNDLFLYPEETFLSNYPDDNTLYSIYNTIESVKKAISNNFRIIENWFHENLMVLNAITCVSELVVKMMTL